jgi:hypothetical protein
MLPPEEPPSMNSVKLSESLGKIVIAKEIAAMAKKLGRQFNCRPNGYFYLKRDVQHQSIGLPMVAQRLKHPEHFLVCDKTPSVKQFVLVDGFGKLRSLGR